MSDYVTFRLDGRDLATRIGAVREVVRLSPLLTLPGMRPPLAGLLDLRGVSLPVVDVRVAGHGTPGDVIVLHGDGAPYGFVCDAVSAVVGTDALVPEDSSTGDALPDYVEGVLRGPSGPVFLVDVAALAGPVELPDSLPV